MDYEIDRHILGRVFDRRDNSLRILKIDVLGDGEAKKAALLLPMDIVITRDACDLSIARIACARRTAYHRPMNKGCSTMIAKKTHKSDEKSNDMAS